jgi:hypothetical protein
LRTIPHIGRLLCASIDDLLISSDHLIVVQKQAESIRGKIAQSGLPVLDLLNA